MTIIDVLLGRRLSNRDADTRKIGWFEAVPTMGLDGLGSASYGPEAPSNWPDRKPKRTGPRSDANGNATSSTRWRHAASRLPACFCCPPYRQIHGPLLGFIEKTDAETSGRSVAVLIPEMVRRAWWEGPLHNHRAQRLRRMLVEHDGPRVDVIIVPWRV